MIWKCVVDRPFMNCKQIFPTKQKYVRELIDAFSEDENVKTITVFGSAVTSACNPWSDVDVYVELGTDNRPSVPSLNTAIDLWTNFDVDSRLQKEILSKGVEVYVRGNTVNEGIQ